MDAHNYPAPVKFSDEMAASQWLNQVPPYVIENMGQHAINMHNHYYGE